MNHIACRVALVALLAGALAGCGAGVSSGTPTVEPAGTGSSSTARTSPSESSTPAVGTPENPPPPQAGVIRLGTPARTNLPPLQQPVRRRDGSTALLSMTGLDRQGGRLVGHVRVQDGFQVTVLDLGGGESGEVYGVRIRVVHLWSMPDPVHDAIDVTVT